MDSVLNFLSGRNWFWWVNEIGIFLEVIGAALLVSAAFRSRSQIKDIKDTWDANLTEKIRDIIADQAFTELKGFVLLAVGLVCQIIGGFSG
jgi:hypothetical protein